jgi:hypothetical protein
MPRLSSASLDDLAARGGIIVDLDNPLVGYGKAYLSTEDPAAIIVSYSGPSGM